MKMMKRALASFWLVRAFPSTTPLRRHGPILRTVAATLRRWTVRVPVKSCKDAKARHVFVKCTVLGGALDLPILTNFIQPFKAVKE